MVPAGEANAPVDVDSAGLVSSTVAFTACAFFRDRAKISEIDLARATCFDPRGLAVVVASGT